MSDLSFGLTKNWLSPVIIYKILWNLSGMLAYLWSTYNGNLEALWWIQTLKWPVSTFLALVTAFSPNCILLVHEYADFSSILHIVWLCWIGMGQKLCSFCFHHFHIPRISISPSLDIPFALFYVLFSLLWVKQPLNKLHARIHYIISSAFK